MAILVAMGVWFGYYGGHWWWLYYYINVARSDCGYGPVSFFNHSSSHAASLIRLSSMPRSCVVKLLRSAPSEFPAAIFSIESIRQVPISSRAVYIVSTIARGCTDTALWGYYCQGFLPIDFLSGSV